MLFGRHKPKKEKLDWKSIESLFDDKKEGKEMNSIMNDILIKLQQVNNERKKQKMDGQLQLKDIYNLLNEKEKKAYDLIMQKCKEKKKI